MIRRTALKLIASAVFLPVAVERVAHAIINCGARNRTYVWHGRHDTNWYDSRNWYGGCLPGKDEPGAHIRAAGGKLVIPSDVKIDTLYLTSDMESVEIQTERSAVHPDIKRVFTAHNFKGEIGRIGSPLRS